MTKGDIRNLLIALGFVKDMVGDMWRRSFTIGTEICVDCANERFLYDEVGITVTTATTSNFSQPENFVVFECVCQLLAKGYRPRDIELEPAWKFGHNEKAARADIWVRTSDKSGRHSLLIIECKTSGREFESAWRDTCEDGGQLFSYFHQERATSFLCLYTSDLVEDKDGKKALSHDYRLINVHDNADYLKTLKKPKTYAKADNAKALFAAWRDTYRLDAAKVGLFEPDIAPYKPGKNKYSLADLSEIDHASMQRKYNEFATILRQHNVSGRENAFDKLVNLFLAKVVDESRNGGELMFYWKGVAYDSAFDLQDRLESLYSIGMKEFLGETVTYIREADIKKAFRRFEKDPDATKDAVLDYFRRLKFYTNNDFSFIDVHNERLFLENAAILLKIVQMLEDIRLKTDEPNQFLGDLFEGFLDNGVKQSEGQFFTPLPVVRFIVSSLPLQEMVRNLPVPPRVIDYACGAGHFLNEYAQQIKPFIETYHKGREKDFYSVITGVEKEYRLSKVAKVAAFMYGEDDIKIVYADALMKSSDMPEESFDLLVANPPYSVKGFLETLSEDDRDTEEYYFIRAQEHDRLYYFLLADANPVPVLLVKMPTETKAAKAFLGYEWSRAKGNEGIKYLGAGRMSVSPVQEAGGSQLAATDDDTLSRNRGIKSINTPLFDNSRLHEEDAPKLNSLIRKNFRGILSDIPEELKPFARRVPLTDMLDSDSATFDKQIKTNATEKVEVKSKFPLVRLGEVAPYATARIDYSKIEQSTFISTENMLPSCGGVVPYEGTPNVDSVIAFRKGDVLVSNIRPYLKKLWLADRNGGCSPDVLVFRPDVQERVPPTGGSPSSATAIPEYLAQLLCLDEFFAFMMRGDYFPVVFVDQQERAYVGTSVAFPPAQSQLYIDWTYPMFNRREFRKTQGAIGGDSSSPKFFVVGDDLILLGVTHFGGTAGGAFVTRYIAKIERAMLQLLPSSAYGLRFFDFSPYQMVQEVPE